MRTANRLLPSVLVLSLGGVSPASAQLGFFLGMPDFDLAYAAPVGESTLLVPRLGGSAIVAAGQDVGGAVFGYNLGVGVIARTSRATALRIDYTYRRFSVDQSFIRSRA